MKTVTLTQVGSDAQTLQLSVDGQTAGEHTFSDVPYESTDAWAVYHALKALEELGVIELNADLQIVDWYSEKPRPHYIPGLQGMPGPRGLQGDPGKCECESRVASLEARMAELISRQG